MKNKLIISAFLLLGILIITSQTYATKTTTFIWPEKTFDESSESQRNFHVVVTHKNNMVIKEEIIDEYHFSVKDKETISSYIFAAETFKSNPYFTSPYLNMTLHQDERYFKSVISIDMQSVKKSKLNEHLVSYIGVDSFDKDGIVKFDLLRNVLVKAGFIQK